jgi:hypothetical protein
MPCHVTNCQPNIVTVTGFMGPHLCSWNNNSSLTACGLSVSCQNMQVLCERKLERFHRQNVPLSVESSHNFSMEVHLKNYNEASIYRESRITTECWHALIRPSSDPPCYSRRRHRCNRRPNVAHKSKLDRFVERK